MDLNNKKKIFILSFLSILTLIAIAILSYQYYQEQNNSEQNNDSYDPNPSTNPDLDGNENEEWQKYIDSEFGFSFDHPKDWQVTTSFLGSFKSIKVYKDNYSLTIRVRSENEPDGFISDGGYYNEKYFNYASKYTIDGIEVWIPRPDNIEELGQYKSTYIAFPQTKEMIEGVYSIGYVNNKRLFILDIDYGDFINNHIIDELHSITQTLKWSSLPYKTWLTYTDPDFGFSFEYPESWKLETSDVSIDTKGQKEKSVYIYHDSYNLHIIVRDNIDNTIYANVGLDKETYSNSKEIKTQNGLVLKRLDINYFIKSEGNGYIEPLNLLSPVKIFDKENEDGYIGHFSTNFYSNGYIYTIIINNPQGTTIYNQEIIETIDKIVVSSNL